MPKGLSLVLFLGYCTLLQGVFLKPATAQVTPDGTTNTTVDISGNDFTIEQGDRAEGNLFHSFGEFSVPTDGSAFFNNAVDIVNIFSRVTGGNISNIDGLLGANGSANLFLLNPAGIIFGENARLAIGGSFFGTTADSLLFDDGTEFSARDSDNPPLLKISTPIGLGLGDNPGDIVNRSFAANSAGNLVGLEVTPGNNLTLVGGNINFEAGEATARGGNIELGGLSAAGRVGISEDGSLSFPEDVARADISLSNAADVDVRGMGGGSITINARNLNLFGSGFIRAGIIADSTSSEAQAEGITINATDNVVVDNTIIENKVDLEAVGDAGGVTISTGSLSLTNGGRVSANTFGQGNAGNINLVGRSLSLENGAQISTSTFGQGNGGEIAIDTGSLSLTNGGLVLASTFGQGNAGTIEITASDTVTIDGGSVPSGVASQVGPEAEGDVGGVTITTGFLTLTNGGLVDAGTLGQGNAGVVEITASNTITIDGERSGGVPSSVTSQVNPGAEGDAGGITITTVSLCVTNGGQVDASTFGQGNAGVVEITARDTITIDGEQSGGIPSSASSQVTPGAEGDAGGVTISTGSLSLNNGGLVDASTLGQGNAGSLTVQANSVSLDNNASISASTQSGAGGIINLQINEDLTLRNNSFISAEAINEANGGNLNIDARFILAFPSSGNGNDLLATANRGNGGNININAQQIFNLQEGIAIDENSNFILNNRNDIDASSDFGLDGTIEISDPDANLAQDERLSTEVVDLDRLIAQNLCQRGDESEFIITGKGGMAPSPSEPRDGEISEVDLVEPAPFVEDGEEEDRGEPPLEIQQASEDSSLPEEEIVQAQGWIINEQGKIRLVAYKTDPNSSPTRAKEPPVCHQ